jgi:hypothetical protein
MSGGPDPAPPCREDARQAVLIAVDAAKQLMAVGVVVLVGIGTLAQFALDKGIGGRPVTAALLVTAVLLVVVALILGMAVVARAYRGGAGLIQDGRGAWDVGRLRFLLGWQARLGLLALLVLGTAIATWRVAPAASDRTGQLALAEPFQDPVRVFATPLRVRGDLRGLRLREGDGPELALTDVAGEVTLTCLPAR